MDNAQTIVDGTKKCSKCDKILVLTEFHKSSRSSTGLSSRCKSCASSYPSYYKSSGRKNAIMRNYGITEEEYDYHMSFDCWICGSSENLHLDHCHSTSKIRGALCQKCNMALGLFEDSPLLLQNAIDWVTWGK